MTGLFWSGINNPYENYRPIANLCSSSKIFEKLILKQIQYLENKNKLDLTGKRQHGFKKTKARVVYFDQRFGAAHSKRWSK